MRCGCYRIEKRESSKIRPKSRCLIGDYCSDAESMRQEERQQKKEREEKQAIEDAEANEQQQANRKATMSLTVMRQGAVKRM